MEDGAEIIVKTQAPGQKRDPLDENSKKKLEELFLRIINDEEVDFIIVADAPSSQKGKIESIDMCNGHLLKLMGLAIRAAARVEKGMITAQKQHG